MSECRFYYTNLWDTGSLTYSSQDQNFPASNTRHRWHTKVWRSTCSYGEWLKVDLGAATQIKTIILKHNNFSPYAVVKVQANSTDSWGSPAFEATLSTISNDIMLSSFDQTYRFWRLYIIDTKIALAGTYSGGKILRSTDYGATWSDLGQQASQSYVFSLTSNYDNYISLGRIYLGTYFQPSRYIHEGYTLNRIDPSALALTEGGQISSIQRTKYRRLTYLFSGMTSSDKTSFEAMFASRGLAKDLFVCDDTDNAQSNTYYVRLANDLEIRHLTGDKFEIAITPEELR